MLERLRIPYAKLVDNLTGLSQDVMLPSARLAAGAEHYSEKLHGPKRLLADNRAAAKDAETAKVLGSAKRYQLLCGGCRGSALAAGAEIHYHSRSAHRVGGTVGDVAEHFATNPRQAHINCDFKTAAAPAKSKREYDESLGYRLHLNIGGVADHFNARSLAHTDAAGRIVYHDRHIAALEPYPIRTAADLIDFIEKCPTERLRQTVVIHKGYDPIPWHEFCIRRDRKSRNSEPVASPRFIHLVESLMQRNHNAAFPVFMEVSFIKPVTATNGYTNARGISRSMLWEGKSNDDSADDLLKTSSHIQPRVIVRNLDNPAMAHVIPEAGSYFVLGHTRLVKETKSGYADYFLDINVTDPGQITRQNVDEIAPASRAEGKVQKPQPVLENRLS